MANSKGYCGRQYNAFAANGIYAAGTVINANTGAGALTQRVGYDRQRTGDGGCPSVRQEAPRFAHRIKVWLD